MTPVYPHDSTEDRFLGTLKNRDGSAVDVYVCGPMLLVRFSGADRDYEICKSGQAAESDLVHIRAAYAMYMTDLRKTLGAEEIVRLVQNVSASRS